VSIIGQNLYLALFDKHTIVLYALQQIEEFMKKIFVIVLALCCFSSSAFAASGIFCRANDRIYSAMTNEGFLVCAEAMAFGKACFTGERSEVIDIINSGYFEWDEEWLQSAHYSGKNDVAYVYVDGPGRIKAKTVMKRCTKEFFN